MGRSCRANERRGDDRRTKQVGAHWDGRIHEWIVGVRQLVFSETGMIKHSVWQCLQLMCAESAC